MDEWTTGVRPGYRTKTLRHGNCTIIVHRPILEPDEMARRERQVIDAMTVAMRSTVARDRR